MTTAVTAPEREEVRPRLGSIVGSGTPQRQGDRQGILVIAGELFERETSLHAVRIGSPRSSLGARKGVGLSVGVGVRPKASGARCSSPRSCDLLRQVGGF